MSQNNNSIYGPQGTPTAINPLWGMTTTHGNCLGFFQELQKCYIQADVPEKECSSWHEDYVECKTHLKEASHFNAYFSNELWCRRRGSRSLTRCARSHLNIHILSKDIILPSMFFTGASSEFQVSVPCLRS